MKILPNNQKGVSLIITFFVMIIVLFVVLSVSTILYNEIKVIKNVGNSVESFYVADSGTEKVLYYDISLSSQNVPGLCAMFDKTNPKYCLKDQNPYPAGEHSVYCNTGALTNTSTYGLTYLNNQTDGCNFDKCNYCEADFNTYLSQDQTSSGKNYTITAKVLPSLDGKSVDLSIDSSGFYQNVERSINTTISKLNPPQIVNIEDASATPNVISTSETITINAKVSDNDACINRVYAYIKNSYSGSSCSGSATGVGACKPIDKTIEVLLSCTPGLPIAGEIDCGANSPTLPAGDYWVDIYVTDTNKSAALDANIAPVIP